MWLRAIAILFALVVHGAVGLAMWPRLANEELEVLDIGDGHDIELLPQGMVVSAISNRGDDVESVETPDVLPIDQRRPTLQPAIDTAPKALQAVPDNIEQQETQDVAAVDAQKPTAQAPTVTSSAELLAVPDAVAEARAADPAAIQAQEPTVRSQTLASSERVDDLVDVIGSKSVEQGVTVQARTPLQERSTAKPAEQLRDVSGIDESPIEQDVATAAETPSTEPLKEPSSGKAGDLPPLNQLKDSPVTQSEAPSPPQPVREQKPEENTVEARPEQVAIVTEQSAGAATTGGDARVIGLYLGKINDRVQNSKVNPRSQATGVVVLKYTVGLDGALIAKEVTSSSKSQILDNAALAALNRAAPFPPIPANVSLRPMTFTQSFRFVTR